MNLFHAVIATGWCLTLTNGQPLGFQYKTPELVWINEATVGEGGDGVGEGNGLYMSPDGDTLVSTSVMGTVRAFDPVTGSLRWTYVPNRLLGLPIRCFSGVTFSVFTSDIAGAPRNTPFLVYAVADGADNVVSNPDAITRVIVLDLDSGHAIFQSTPLSGIAAGTPVTDAQGTHILLTHNVDKLIGYISIFALGDVFQDEAAMMPKMSPPVFTGRYVDGDSNERPFSPIGYFHNPEGGYYEKGQFNTNDFFMFAWDTPRTANSVNEGEGQKFAVQFPLSYLGDGEELSFFVLGGPINYHASTPPVLANAGRSYYWSVSKGGQECVVGRDALPRYRFDRNHRTAYVAMQRGRPRYRSSRAPPTLGPRDPDKPMVCGVGASTQVWCMDYEYSTKNRTIIEVPDIVSTRILFTPDEDLILFGTQSTVTPGGLHVHRTGSGQLEEVWSVPIPGGVEGDIALDMLGTTVYAANPWGQLRAYRFAQP